MILKFSWHLGKLPHSLVLTTTLDDYNPLSQMRTLRLREGRQFAEGYRAHLEVSSPETFAVRPPLGGNGSAGNLAAEEPPPSTVLGVGGGSARGPWASEDISAERERLSHATDELWLLGQHGGTGHYRGLHAAHRDLPVLLPQVLEGLQ